MIVGRALGWALIILGLVALGRDAWLWIDGRFAGGVAAAGGAGFHLTPGGELWYQLSPGSLNFLQAIVQRYVWPPLWDSVIVTVLLWPAALVLIGLGLILVLAFRPWRRRRRAFR